MNRESEKIRRVLTWTIIDILITSFNYRDKFDLIKITAHLLSNIFISFWLFPLVEGGLQNMIMNNRNNLDVKLMAFEVIFILLIFIFNYIINWIINGFIRDLRRKTVRSKGNYI